MNIKSIYPSILEEIEKGNINCTKHPTEDLYIYNYSHQVQFNGEWNEATKICRGLILDAEQNIVARPFPKFFNLEQHKPEEIPSLAFDVYEKMDGSLGILYFINDEVQFATRGSFISEQSQEALKIWNEKYGHLKDQLKRDRTYLFEIIYPSNRIVVNYGDKRDLVLLAVIDLETGSDHPFPEGFNAVKRYDFKSLDEIKSLQATNMEDEGFVIRFSNGFRCKAKHAEYVRLHRILTCVSTKSIWEFLKNGDYEMKDLIDRVPDEFYAWVKETRQGLMDKFKVIEDEAKSLFEKYNVVDYNKDFKENRKNFAKSVMSDPDAKALSGIIFSMLDGHDYRESIWKMVKPEYSKAFKVDVDG